MKKFLLVLGAVALFTACGDDSGSGTPINYEEGYKYLTNLNVSDAKMIYQKSSLTRATGDDSYYKLDLSGNEVKLSIKGEDGQDHNIGIHKVLKLSDKVLLVNPVAQDIVDLFYKPSKNNDDEYVSVDNSSTEYLSIVDVQTEKIYRWPKEMHISLYEGTELKTALDNQGNIYLAYSDSNYPVYNQIYKLNTSNFTLQNMLPDNVACNGFIVTDNGFIVYWNGIEQQQNCRVKCPGGRIYPIADIYTFIFNGELYSVRDKDIIKHETIGNNELKEKAICTMPDNNTYWEFTSNHVRNTMVINGSLEFDGEKCTTLNRPISIGNLRTSKAWYSYNNTTFSKIAMKDYQESQFKVSEYEIQSLSANSESPNIAFTGFRYLDGANVVGTITELDEIVIDNVANNGEKIINLISLN